MENSPVVGLRSRSRSKTPFLRSSCDRESCGREDHVHHKSGRKTPIKRSTPVKQLKETSSRTATETITEEDEHESPPAHRTRLSMKADKLVKTSDYSSEESLDRLRGNRKQMFQNEANNQYEHISTSVSSSRRYGTLEDVTFSPIHVSNLTSDRTARFGSPTYSGCSTDSSFAEQALADTSTLLEHDPSPEHLPYRLYRMAGEYWNKYPKTDYTYSPLSKDRVELAPGQVAVPNMSRRSLSQFRVQGPLTSAHELDRLTAATLTTSTKTLRKRFTSAVDSSDDESYMRGNGGFVPQEERWWITRLLVAIVTTVTTTVSSAYHSVVGPSHRYPYSEPRPAQASLASRTAAAVASPFYWIYTLMKKVVTTTVTTITETVTPNHVSEREMYTARSYKTRTETKRRWWPWLLLLLLPIIGYGSHYTYENLDRLALPNFTDFQLDFPEMNILPKINLTLPTINLTLPDISDNLPEVRRTYREYKDIVQNRVADASDYMKVVADSCYEEMRRFWSGVIG